MHVTTVTLSFTHVRSPGTVWHWEQGRAVTDAVPGGLSRSAAPLGLRHAPPPQSLPGWPHPSYGNPAVTSQP